MYFAELNFRGRHPKTLKLVPLHPIRLTSKNHDFALDANYFAFDWKKIGILGIIFYPWMPNKKEVVNLSFLALLELTSVQNTVPTRSVFFSLQFCHFCQRFWEIEDLPMLKENNADREFDWFKESLTRINTSRSTNADRKLLMKHYKTEIIMAA